MKNLELNDPRLLDQSLVVSASAGSGKTFTLTVLVCAILGAGKARPYEILATTFSEAAASDLRERLLRPLDLLASLDEESWSMLLPLLENPLALKAMLLEVALTPRLAKSRGEVLKAAGMWGHHAWMDSARAAQAFWRKTRREAELMPVSTLHSLALRLLKKGEGAPDTILDAAHPALLRLLRQTLREHFELPAGHPDELAARALRRWIERRWEQLSGAHDGHRDALGELEPDDPAEHREAFFEALTQAERAFAPFVADPSLAVDKTNRYVKNFKPSNLLGLPGPDAESLLRLRWAMRQSKVLGGDLAGYYSDDFRDAYAALEPVADAWEAWLRSLLVSALQDFETRKSRHGMGTFGDLVRKALQALELGSLKPPAMKYLLVDEYQDTSRAQDAFLGYLRAAHIIRVGDVKQAIYGFRGGDPQLLRDHLAAVGSGACRLPSNFRCAAPIVSLANRYVEELWPQLDPGAGELDGHQETADDSATPVGLVRVQSSAKGSCLDEMSPWIQALSVESGWALLETDGLVGQEEKSVRPSRALLLEARTKLPVLLRRLKEGGVKPYVIAKDGFWDSPGVRLLMTALEAVAHPGRARPCAVLLRNLVGLTDGEMTALLALPQDASSLRKGLPGLGQLDPERLPASYQDSARWLLSLRQASTQGLAAAMLAQGELLRQLGAQSVHGAMESLRARRNLAGFISLLMELPDNPAVAFAALEELRLGVARGDMPASASGADLVIQTAHGSKGLEYDDVILPLLHRRARSLVSGDIHTHPETRELRLAWKFGSHPGAAYRALKPVVEGRQRRDSLNLLYVALTRAKRRLCLLLQDVPKPKSRKEPLTPLEAKSWAEWGAFLAEVHLEMKPLLGEAPAGRLEGESLDASRTEKPKPGRWISECGQRVLPLLDQGMGGEEDPAGVSKVRQEGVEMHEYLRDLLLRWEDREAFEARLACPPEISQARENSLRFLERFEAKGWRYLRRRTEYPLAGAGEGGGEGRADLVVWDHEKACIHLLDFKHCRRFSAMELETYQRQLQRYATAVKARFGCLVHAWLVPLKGEEWVAMAL